ncbi:hypothetical protein POM88_029675 [Heracleum sosnowskyi]|uniref:Uncharacterized protein n=1 Tax=Heracleum sosnowskyi TaxID=360622 RepID=A0AAD8HW14_9APIA|nr:hypothetical protein POM88_029675 [Heracleum sosnowskyi]
MTPLTLSSILLFRIPQLNSDPNHPTSQLVVPISLSSNHALPFILYAYSVLPGIEQSAQSYFAWINCHGLNTVVPCDAYVCSLRRPSIKAYARAYYGRLEQESITLFEYSCTLAER